MFRIVLFLATNMAIIVLLGIVMSLLGVDSRTTSGLLVMAAIFGMGGSFISLAISKWIAKKSTGAQVIVNPSNPTEQWLYDTVRRMAAQAEIGMPEVAIYDSPDMNAFATGMKKNDALVAVSTGLLQNMSKDEVEAVLAHEITHVACGDMVTMALIQGVVNAFVMFFSRIIAFAISQALPRGENGEPHPAAGMVMMIGTIVLEIAFSVLGSIVVAWFSRQREYRADAGGASLAGRGKMVAALAALQRTIDAPREDTPALASMKISGGGMMALFSTHPPLEERIARLQADRG